MKQIDASLDIDPGVERYTLVSGPTTLSVSGITELSKGLVRITFKISHPNESETIDRMNRGIDEMINSINAVFLKKDSSITTTKCRFYSGSIFMDADFSDFRYRDLEGFILDLADMINDVGLVIMDIINHQPEDRTELSDEERTRTGAVGGALLIGSIASLAGAPVVITGVAAVAGYKLFKSIFK